MNIDIKSDGNRTDIGFSGRLDAAISAENRAALLAAARPGARLHLDFSELEEVTSTGLRMLLTYSRFARLHSAAISTSGVSRKIADLADAAGFSLLFRHPRTPCPQEFSSQKPRVPIDVYPSHFHEG